MALVTTLSRIGSNDVRRANQLLNRQLPSDPTPEEIEARKAEIHARRLEQFDAALDAAEKPKPRPRRTTKRQVPTVGTCAADQINALLQQNDQVEPIDLDAYRWQLTDSASSEEVPDHDDALADDAERRGVLNYFSIARRRRLAAAATSHANVELYDPRSNEERYTLAINGTPLSEFRRSLK